MADIADYAAQAADFNTNVARQNIDLAPDAVAVGKCLNCELPLTDGRRWCSPACRDEWQEYNKR